MLPNDRQFFEFMQNLTFGETFVHFQGTADAFSHDAKALAVAIKVSETVLTVFVECSLKLIKDLMAEMFLTVDLQKKEMSF